MCCESRRPFYALPLFIRYQSSNPRRKSRSRERPRTELLSSIPINSDIRERERELERIHRRSRELMLSPRIADLQHQLQSPPPPLPNRSRDSSLDRLTNGGRHEEWIRHPHDQRRGHHHRPPAPLVSPPPLPPRIHSPQNSVTSQGSSISAAAATGHRQG